MIPKKIHYCWFGGKPLPELAVKCIESWKKFFPDYEIIEWNESNFDINFNKYAKCAYENKKYAFFTDVARLYIIYNYGGIYFDVDVEVIKNFDSVLDDEAFFGLESEGYVNTGLGFGAEPKNWMVKQILNDYSDKNFGNENFELIPCPIKNSTIFKEKGFSLKNSFQKINGVSVYPIDFFNPKGGYGCNLKITNNTLSIHHYDGSWISEEEKKRSIMLGKLSKKYGDKKGKLIYMFFFFPVILFSSLKELGLKKTINKFLKKLFNR